MRSFVLGLAVAVAFAGTSVAQTTSRTTGTIKPTTTQTKTPVAQKAAPARSAQRPTPQQATTPKAVRAAGRYGGFAMTAPPPPPPVLDTTSPRSLNLVNANTGEALSVTYWSNGSYQRAALDKLNHFLRDWRENEQTEMDPLLFDVLWHTMNTVGFSGTVEVLSAFRSPSTNARSPRGATTSTPIATGACSTASPSASTRATGSASSGATAPASRPCCGCSPDASSPTPAGSPAEAG